MKLEVLHLVFDELAAGSQHLVIVEVEEEREALFVAELAAEALGDVIDLGLDACPRPKGGVHG